MPSRQNNAARVVVDNLDDLLADLEALAGSEALVGFPEETSEREPDEDGKSPPTNAALAYIHDNGAPEANIPARPFMTPGMLAAEERLASVMANGARAVLAGKVHSKTGTRLRAEQVLHAAGMVAQNSCRAAIRQGVPPPLAEATLRRRAQKGRKGAQKELDNRAAGLAPSTDLAKPLVDTGEMMKSLIYVVRARTARK